MNKNTTIKEAMTPFPHTIGNDQKLSTAKEMMRKYNVRHLPVQHGGELVGILTERDVNLALALDKEYEKSLTIEDVCTLEPYVVNPAVNLGEVAQRMAADKIGCALVAEHGKLIGIYTTIDACKNLAQLLG